MKTLLVHLLFVLFLAANTSKWYGSFGLRLNYYVPVLLLWVVLALFHLSRRRLLVPREIRTLILLKLAFVASFVLTVPVVLLSGESELLETFVLGLIANGINVVGIIVCLLVVTQLKASERARVADLYLLAIGFCAAYTVAQALGAYMGGVDLDRIVGEALPLTSQEVTSIEEEVWGTMGRRFYRFSGLTGDPNLNATTFLMALPVIYHQSLGRPKLPFAILGLTAIAIIVQSISNTVMPIMLLVLLLLTYRYRKASRALTWLTVAGVLLVGGLVWSRASDVITHIAIVKFGSYGTTSAHIRIATDALRLWTEHPFGVGLNGFAVYSPDFSTHNSYLQNLVELGPVGLLVSVATVLYALRVSISARSGFGFVALLVVGGLALSAVGHDVLRRFELELVAYLWVGFAVMERRERKQAATHVPQGVTRPPGDGIL